MENNSMHRYLGISCPAGNYGEDMPWDARHFICLYALSERMINTLLGKKFDKRSTMSPYTLLMLIVENPGIYQHQLCAIAGKPVAYVSLTCTTFVEKGYITSMHSPYIPRQKQYSATEKGIAALNAAYAGVEECIKPITDKLTPKIKHHLYRVLGRLNYVSTKVDAAVRVTRSPYGDAKYSVDLPLRSESEWTGRTLVGLSLLSGRLIRTVMNPSDSERELRFSGYTITVCAIIESSPGVTYRQILQYMDCHTVSLCKILGKLKKQGYVRTETEKTDKSSTRYFLTDAGKNMFDANYESMRRAVEPFNTALSKQYRSSLGRVLHGMDFIIKIIDTVSYWLNQYGGSGITSDCKVILDDMIEYAQNVEESMADDYCVTPTEQNQSAFGVDLSDTIIKAREDRGLSQRDIADLSGVAPSAIASLESMQLTPQVESLIKILTPLGYRLNVSPIEPQKNK